MTEHQDRIVFNDGRAVARDLRTGKFVPAPIDHRTGEPRLTPERRAELEDKYPSLRDDPQWRAAPHPRD